MQLADDNGEKVDKEKNSANENDDEIHVVMNQIADLESCVQNTNLARRPGEDDIVCATGKEKERVNPADKYTLQEGFVLTDDHEKTAMVTVLDKASSQLEK